MPGLKALDPHPPEFDRFLHASVGEDKNGYAVTVLSALARLGLDPWQETAELVTLRRGDAKTRLGAMLARFRDVPALASDHDRIARELTHLLPEGRSAESLKHADAAAAGGRRVTGGTILTVLAIALFLFQIFVGSGSGSGK